MELGCAATGLDGSLNGREGEREEGGAIYDENPVIKGIWVDSYCTGAV